jgi:hypothetical protein
MTPRSSQKAVLTPWIRSLCYGILWFEVLTNVLNGVLTLINPKSALRIMTDVKSLDAFDGVAGEPARWFAAVGMTFGGFLLTRVLLLPPRIRSNALWPVLEALVVGDVLYLSSLIPFTLHYSSQGIVLPYALTLIMFLARVTLLLWENWK